MGEQGLRLRGNPCGRGPHLLRNLIEEIGGEFGNIFTPLAQWGQGDRHNTKTKIQIFPKTFFFDGGCQILICGRDDAHVRLESLASSDPGELTLLEDAEQLCLKRRGHVAYFIQEEGPTSGLFKLPGMPLNRTGECPTFVAEQLAFEQLERNGRTVHPNKGRPPAG